MSIVVQLSYVPLGLVASIGISSGSGIGVSSGSNMGVGVTLA
jgi:hypothetical protein